MARAWGTRLRGGILVRSARSGKKLEAFVLPNAWSSRNLAPRSWLRSFAGGQVAPPADLLLEQELDLIFRVLLGQAPAGRDQLARQAVQHRSPVHRRIVRAGGELLYQSGRYQVGVLEHCGSDLGRLLPLTSHHFGIHGWPSNTTEGDSIARLLPQGRDAWMGPAAATSCRAGRNYGMAPRSRWAAAAGRADFRSASFPRSQASRISARPVSRVRKARGFPRRKLRPFASCAVFRETLLSRYRAIGRSSPGFSFFRKSWAGRHRTPSSRRRSLPR